MEVIYESSPSFIDRILFILINFAFFFHFHDTLGFAMPRTHPIMQQSRQTKSPCPQIAQIGSTLSITFLNIDLLHLACALAFEVHSVSDYTWARFEFWEIILFGLSIFWDFASNYWLYSSESVRIEFLLTIVSSYSRELLLLLSNCFNCLALVKILFEPILLWQSKMFASTIILLNKARRIFIFIFNL